MIRSNNSTSIVRVKKNSNYTTINNTCLRDTRLSWKAKGIMAYFLSLPDDWVINLDEIMTHSKGGEKSFRSGLDELKSFGYVERKQIRDGKKIVGWETIIYELPETVDTTLLAQKVDVGFVHVENEGLLSTNNSLNTNNTNKDIKTLPQQVDGPSNNQLEEQFDQWYSFYPKKVNKKKAFDKFKLKVKKHGFEKVLQGMASYAKVMELNGTEKQYIKGPDVFLNGEHYLDDHSELIKQKPAKQQTYKPWEELAYGTTSNSPAHDDYSQQLPKPIKQIGW